jgi:hypothetical protein
MPHVMKLYPFEQVVNSADQAISMGATVFQQFNCEHCGTKQTIEEGNAFYTRGHCEECKKITDIKTNGCNYMILVSGWTK